MNFFNKKISKKKIALIVCPIALFILTLIICAIVNAESCFINHPLLGFLTAISVAAIGFIVGFTTLKINDVMQTCFSSRITSTRNLYNVFNLLINIAQFIMALGAFVGVLIMAYIMYDQLYYMGVLIIGYIISNLLFILVPCYIYAFIHNNSVLIEEIRENTKF